MSAPAELTHTHTHFFFVPVAPPAVGVVSNGRTSPSSSEEDVQEPMKRTDSASGKSEDLKSEVGRDDPALITRFSLALICEARATFIPSLHGRRRRLPRPALPLGTRLHHRRKTATSGEEAAGHPQITNVQCSQSFLR